MSEYTDTGFGFSFWYPSNWQIAQVPVGNPAKYAGGTVSKQFNITNGQRVITVEEFTSSTFTISDNTGVGACPVCVVTKYYFDRSLHTWMVQYPNGTTTGKPAGTIEAANVSNNTMGGLHMLAGSQRFGANVIIPLSAENFVIVTVDGAIATESSDPQALAKTVVALDPSVATPVSVAEQKTAIQNELSTYAGLYGLSTENNSSSGSANPDMANLGWLTYDNFDIRFQYPGNWGIPTEKSYGNGLGSVYFENNASSGQPLMVLIAQDTNPQGNGLLNETFDQMINRFRGNDQLIYDEKDVTAGGVQGKELFYKSAVSGQPYHVEAYFPFQNNAYVSIGADYQIVPQSTFDSIIASLKWDSATAFKRDPATGMAIYNNNGIKFEYPTTFNTNYASPMVEVSVEKTDSSKLDSNGCYPVVGSETGRTGSASVVTISGTKFCYSTNGDVGAGQLYRDYVYTTFRGGSAYTIDYVVHTSNGCGVYYGEPQYNECQNFESNYNSLVVDPIQQSIATFLFTN